MIRTADWKYVYNPATEDEPYDLRSDPGELHNLASMVAYGHVLRRLKQRLLARMRATGDDLAGRERLAGQLLRPVRLRPRTLTRPIGRGVGPLRTSWGDGRLPVASGTSVDVDADVPRIRSRRDQKARAARGQRCPDP